MILGRNPVAQSDRRQTIAVVGSGIAGMSAAWLLSHRHDVTIYEAASAPGGHSHTVDAPGPDGAPCPVDMGFIVYNAENYPNLVAMFDHLGVATKASDMSFGVSMDDGALEYAGTDLNTLFAQRRNLVRPRFWSMLADLLRFYKTTAVHDVAAMDPALTLDQFLAQGRYGPAFRDDHLLPQAAAIWSASAKVIGDYPAAAFIRFFQNHGLLNILKRPLWRTVDGGSRAYVRRLTASVAERTRLGCAVTRVERQDDGVWVTDVHGGTQRFDQIVIGAHADQALAMLGDPSADERAVLGAFGYTANQVVLHTDPALMPRRRRGWSAWNYLGRKDAHGAQALCVSYWMNRLQGLPPERDLFVTLNPIRPIDPDQIIRSETFDHPVFNAAALAAQPRLWSLQGQRRTWFCGAYFGAGFHEDGLQAGLAVAEQLGGVRRPWTVAGESGRIWLGAVPSAALPLAAE